MSSPGATRKATPELQLQLNNAVLPLEESDVTDFHSGPSSVFASRSSSFVDLTRPTRNDGSPLGNGIRLSTSRINSTQPSRSASPSLHADRPATSTRSPHVSPSDAFENKSRRRNSEVDFLSVEPEVLVKFRRWMHAFAIVEFDLDVGPIVCGIYPNLFLSPSEAENVSAFSAFPDSPQFDQGTTNHSFRIRQDVSKTEHEERPKSIDGFMYCFSHFMQRRSSNSKRGYTQRALVFITHRQYPGLFTTLASILGPLFEEHGIPMLESACHNIATWSEPTPGNTVELGFLGSVLLAEIALSDDTQQLATGNARDPLSYILASSAPMSPPGILLFEASISHIWSIWECLVLCEPILVFGSSPAETSQAVWWFRDLLKPIPLAGDVRPYFTIHDQEHTTLVNKLPPKGGLILGVTNPFFERACRHWPHVLSLGKRGSSLSKSPQTSSSMQSVPGWRTKTHNRFTSKDKDLLRQWEDAFSGSYQKKLDASLAMRQHFCHRTTLMLNPLMRYIYTALIPSPNETLKAPKASQLRLKPFNRDNFFASLSTHGTSLPFRSTAKRKAFYERWLRTPSFGLWLAQQEHEVEALLERRISGQRM